MDDVTHISKLKEEAEKMKKNKLNKVKMKRFYQHVGNKFYDSSRIFRPWGSINETTISPFIKCKPREMSTFCIGLSLMVVMVGSSQEFFFRENRASRSWLCSTLRYHVSRCPALPPDLQAEPVANWLWGRHFPDQICYQLLKVDIISTITSFCKRSGFFFFTVWLKTVSWMKCSFYDRFLRLLPAISAKQLQETVLSPWTQQFSWQNEHKYARVLNQLCWLCEYAVLSKPRTKDEF